MHGNFSIDKDSQVTRVRDYSMDKNVSGERVQNGNMDTSSKKPQGFGCVASSREIYTMMSTKEIKSMENDSFVVNKKPFSLKFIWRDLKEMGKRLKHDKSYKESNDENSTSDDNVPDGGWGWAVCFGSFLVNFILDGTMFSFGILLLELLDHFGEGKAKTSWIGSSLLGMSMFMGPVVSMLLERYSCRQITIAGSLVMSGAFIVSVFSPNVEILILTYGIIAGIGCCMSFVSAIIIVGLYFNKKRAIATGIAMSGSGLGTFAYAYITNYLITLYDWRGCILIMGGILLNGTVCAALFRPIATYTKSRSEKSYESSHIVNNIKEVETLLPKQVIDLKDNENYYLQANKAPIRLTLSTNFINMTNEGDVHNNRNFSSQYDFRDISKGKHEHHDHYQSSARLRNQMSKKDIFYSGSLARLPQYHNESSTDDESSCTSEERVLTRGDKDLQNTVCSVFKTNCGLFKDKVFILLLLCNVTWTVQSVPLTFIPDLAVSKNLPTSEAALLISIVGITNIVGRVLSGIITDMFQIKSTVTYTVALLMASVASFLFPWCEGFIQLAICSGVFGLCMATSVAMRTIVLADHLGIDKLTRAFGMIALFQGIAFMANAPFAGYLYEQFHSNVMPFSYAGIMYLASGLLCLTVHCISNGQTEQIREHNIEISVNGKEHVHLENTKVSNGNGVRLEKKNGHVIT